MESRDIRANQNPHEEVVRPRLSSDPPDRHRTPIPRYDVLRKLWKRHHLFQGAKPVAGAMIVGGTAMVLAVELGPVEILIGAAAAYATYRMMRYGIDLREALVETIQLERAVEGR